MESNPKVFWQSKVFWLNLIAVAVAVGYYLLDTPGIIPAQYASYVMAGLGAANLVLRMMTNQPLSLRRSKPSVTNSSSSDVTKG